MPGALTRSKSLRFLTNNRNDTIKQRNERSMPPLKAPPNDSGKLRPAMSTSRAEARCETPDLAIRPSTSGGPGEPTTIFHSKVIAAPSVCSQDQAPALPSYPSFPSFPNSTATLSTNGVTAEEQAHIGIALGSPTVGSHWVSTPHGSNATMMHFPQSSSSPVAIGNRQVAPKSKRSKWKALFRKAAPSPAPDKPSFYQVTQAVMATTSRADSHHGGESPDSQVPLQEETVRAQRTQPPMYKPGTKASPQRAPEDFVAPASPPEFSSTRERTLASGTPPTPPSTTKLQGVFTSPVPPSKDTSNHAQEEPKQIISGRKGCMSTPGSEAGSDQRSLLDVTIPDVTMERYSVMFGTVLQSGTKRSSSLLERRQANAEKIKPLSKLSVQKDAQEVSINFKLPRRATSPAPAGSPRLTLFPSNQSRAPSPLSASRKPGQSLHRSRTAPTKSPVVQTFAQVAMQTVKESALHPSSLKPQTSSPRPKAAITATSIHSYESDTESITILSGQTHSIVQLDAREPTWQICQRPTAMTTLPTPPASSPLQTTHQQQPHPHPTKLSALSSHPSSLPLDASSPLHRLRSLTSSPSSTHPITAKRTPSVTLTQRKDVDVRATRATVGVARSISVSRANSARAALPPSRTDARSPRGERLVERQVLTPTMVEVKNRKSQRVQLDMAV